MRPVAQRPDLFAKALGSMPALKSPPTHKNTGIEARCAATGMRMTEQRRVPRYRYSCAQAGISARAWSQGLGTAGRGCCATARILRQVAPHQKCIQLLPAGLLVIAFPAANDAESRPFVQPPRRLIVFFDLEEDGAHAASGEMA